MAAEKAANPPHPRTPAFSPAAKTKQRKLNISEENRTKRSVKKNKLQTSKSNDTSGYTAAVNGVLPVGFAPVLQTKHKRNMKVHAIFI